MFDFATGNVTQSGLNLSIATHLSHSIPPSRNPRTAHELNLCLRGIAALQNLQGCIVPATASLHNTSHNLSLAPCTSPSLSHLDDAAPDNNISTLASHFSVTWRLARAYAASRVSPDAPPPWDSRSDYSTVMQSHHDIDCRASAKYRFACNRIGDYAPEAIQAQRHWWMPFLFIQFVHETIPCLLNHPFLLSMRLRSFRQTIPVYFMQQSFEAINRNAGWVIYFVDVLEKKGVQVSDPVLAHCANNLRRLQDSIVLRPSPAQQEGSSQSRSFSINSQLLWDLLIYDKAVRPDAGWDQSMFGPTLKADVAELSAEDRAAEFDLVGSAGISGHKAMPNEAAVWPPNEDPPPVDLPQNAGLDAQVGDLAGGPSFEDIFFEGVGPFGDQANRFFDGNDYGRAIDDWLNLGT
ncbi:hypothetical protein K4K58_003846 [Colletotrichum sp. SAR11_239]|nr:hypothetical protein K4K58_003846 [Colletotrichum sp. SAR11_239]